MAPEVLISMGALLGILISLASVVVWRAVRGADSPVDPVEYERLLTDIDEPIAFQRTDGTVAFANAAFRNLVGTVPTGCPIEEALAGVPGLKRRVVEADEGVEAVESGENIRYYDVSLYETDEEMDGQIVLFQDVTDRHEHRCQLQAQNEQLDRFASLISHDLRNPLDVAIGRTNAVIDVADDPDVRNHAQSVQRALDRMETIIDDVLARAREGDIIGDTSPVTLADVCEACWECVETEEATLIAESETTIEAHTEGLSHIFENLFRNAVEHTGPTATIRVGTLPDSDGFYVEDDGPGIPEEDRARLCEPDESGVRCGTGFGLAIVERIAEAHGWRFDITESETGGARFEFSGVETVIEGVATREC